MMQRFYYRIFLCFFIFTSADAAVLDAQGKPSKEVRQIVKDFSHYLWTRKDVDQKIVKKIVSNKEISLAELNTLAQTAFLRPKGSERLSPEALTSYKKLCSWLTKKDKQEILNLFAKIGDIEEVTPSPHESMPDYILIQGSTVPNMRERLMFLASMVESNKINIQGSTTIVFLAGQRALFPSETKEVLLNTSPYKPNTQWKLEEENLPTNEVDAAHLVWDQLELPETLRSKTPIFIKAEKKAGAARAQTEDCVISWLSQGNVKQGLYLIISNNPYIFYQQRVTELKFHQAGYKEGYRIKSLGASASINEDSLDTTIGIFMDNLAREIYTENQFIKQEDIKN